MKNNPVPVALLCLASLFSPLFADELIHVLQKGETLYSISRKYNVPADSIMSYNNISNPDKLFAGQKIKIPDTYTVKKGDTLYGIAKAMNVPVSELMKANALQRDSLLKVGDRLFIPGSGTAATSSSAAASAVSATAPDTPSAPLPVSPAATNPSAPSSAAQAFKPMDDPRSYQSKKIDGNIIWPVSALELSYLSGKVYGVSITAKKGEAVKTVSSGTVLSAGPYRGFGQVVFVQSKSGYIYVYGGLDGISSRPGQQLSFGDEIGTLGADSLSGKPQLYFMVYNKDVPVDPAKAPRGF